jgi:hypothetical protein
MCGPPHDRAGIKAVTTTPFESSDAWMGRDGALFSPYATLRSVPLFEGQYCHVIDNALAQPEMLFEWACAQTFEPAQGSAYPGVLLAAPRTLTKALADYFALHLRQRMGARRTLDASVRLSMVTLAPQELQPCQWQCHRDRIDAGPPELAIVASVLYLFRDPALGGTSFFVPRRAGPATDRMVKDSLALDASEFAARYGLQPGYMTESNQYFERVVTVPAAWNRLIFYDGEVFHSGDIVHPSRMSSNPALGRLTLNGFFTCRRSAT